MKEKINPVGLKGNQINERMKELMGIAPINENRKSSVVELTKLGPDGKAYGIVRENHEYYIKVSNKTKNLTAEDFSYIGGLKNKKQEAYGSYAKAIKQLNLKFNSLNEAYEKSGQINVFEDDNLMGGDSLTTESKSTCCGATINDGVCTECNKSTVNEIVDESESLGDDVELSEVEQSVEDMMDETKKIEDVKVPVKEHRLSIKRSINNMDDIIDSVVGENKKKVYTIG